MENNLIDPKTETKQESWFHTDVDFENSFKFWFALQWQNGYIELFAGDIALLVYMLTQLKETTWFCLIPVLGIAAIAYKGFYQYFQDLKNKTSR